uniref:Replication protein A 14 kDa subunit n=1 Tax=Craspedostauros australis TaxID=1486917 RepID=A0A7R9WU07_9STRA|mmetsp:Transcript_1954/g.5392  ORF Transcript_1954/g.5392 Transcript_1954/m.5392 type:complete len:119 (+) Transcript_1954:149-505(+)|eukprot:CAMPEP_0198115768 /NCGR_PEP_ID=MMETSP1442-20131203/7168_1 /TAXON_ID= /ORGANISM="Craspedostauros australis, Strain CCMP3328" /LENGTH=118 /DNA_ID=CAMNT_0043773341 /DNA_START=128 /DNA_END=484 /DNA_ORIENTATION=+
MADGVYPRVDKAMLETGQYTESLVSLVGTVAAGGTKEQVQLNASDGAAVFLDTTQVETPLCEVAPEMVLEIIGHVQADGSVMAFVSRELGTDMDLVVYNKMIKLQMDPAYAACFVAST